MNTLLAFIVCTLIYWVILLISMKLTGVHGSVVMILAASAAANLVSLIPVSIFGNFLPLIVLIWLLSKWTSGDIWPDIILMVIVSWGLRMILVIIVVSHLINMTSG